MAVQKSRKSRSKRGMRRANRKVDVDVLSVEATTGETHVRHHISDYGYYKGQPVNIKKEKKKQAPLEGEATS
jgi:large subunit ribosomal protein L32